MTQRGSWLIPEDVDLLVVGGGTAGAALAGIVARDSDLSVLLLEAGPDYGPLADGRWPGELLDARRIPPGDHDWGYRGLAHPTHAEPTPFDRARVIGGCSAHNGCVALIGHRRDYDGWADLGNPGWGWEWVRPAFERALRTLRVRSVAEEEITPYQRAFIEGAVAAGIPRVADLNDPDAIEGVGASPVNISGGVRWNTALAYLDPVRARPNLRVVGEALVDRIEIADGRAVAVRVLIDGEARRVAARRIVLSAGAYGSPAILLRSGVGEEAELRRHGISLIQPLPGVGRGLADHPAVYLGYRPTERLSRMMAEADATGWLPEEQALAKTRSSRCDEAFDLHLYAVSVRDVERNQFDYRVYVSSVAPRSQGRVRLRSADPSEPPEIDHGYLGDVDGYDVEVLVDGVEIARRVMAPAIESGLLAAEACPGAGVAGRAEIAEFARGTVGIYYHPGCSCRMGPAAEDGAVVDARGRVHGLDGLYVCDASIFPRLTRSNTNVPAAMLAEHLAAGIAAL